MSWFSEALDDVGGFVKHDLLGRPREPQFTPQQAGQVGAIAQPRGGGMGSFGDFGGGNFQGGPNPPRPGWLDPAIGAVAMPRGPGVEGSQGAGGGDQGGTLDKIWEFIKKNPQLVTGTALAGAQVVDNVQQRNRQNRRQDEADERAREEYEQGRRYRDELLGTVGPPPKPKDYSDVFTDEGNPYTRNRVARATR